MRFRIFTDNFDDNPWFVILAILQKGVPCRFEYRTLLYEYYQGVDYGIPPGTTSTVHLYEYRT